MSIDGSIDIDDMSYLLGLINITRQRTGKVQLYMEVEGFGGSAIDSNIEAMKFLFKFGCETLSAIVLVTDKLCLQKMYNSLNTVFQHTDIKVFSMAGKCLAQGFVTETN
ncbi:MAG: STAS/SEC14 domain-containing protein [Pseudomonadales bacterium]|nr:STAS/SEC14 domain-containing protein [Pseudomonadales bacterium]